MNSDIFPVTLRQVWEFYLSIQLELANETILIFGMS